MTLSPLQSLGFIQPTDRLIKREIIDKAKPLLNALHNAVHLKRTTSIDFSGLSIITTAFLNNSIGKLYALYDASELNKYIKFDTSSLMPLQKERIQMIIKNAKSKLSQDEIMEEID